MLLRKKGFTLIEMMLVLVVMMSITLMKIQDINNDVMKVRADALANNIKTVASATNAFIVMKYNDLANLNSPDATCTTSNQTCTITTDILKGYNLLPPNFSNNSSIGRPYIIQLKRSGIAPNYMISGLVLTNGIPSNEANVNQVLLGNTIQSIGSEGGVNKTDGKMTGNLGQWNTDSATFPVLAGKKDYVGAVVGNLSGAYYVYLRRDGSLPMTGDLNLDGNNITKIKDLTATGKIVAAGTISAGGNIQAKNGYGDILSIGGDAANNDYEVVLHSPKPLTINSPSSVSYTTVLNVNRNMTVSQRLGLMGKDPNDIPTGWSGGLRTTDVYADGTIGTGTARNVNAYMNSSGKIFASGNIEGGTITSKGRLVTDEYLQINGLAVAGAVCANNGLQGKDSNGAILSCISGKWGSSASGFIKAPKPQEISCTPKFESHGVSAKIDENGIIYTKFSNNPWKEGVTSLPNNEYNKAQVSLSGLSYVVTGETCGSNDNCQNYRHECSALWQ